MNHARVIQFAAMFALFAGASAAAELSVTVVDLAGRPVERAVAWLTPIAGKLPAAPSRPVVVDQQQRRFVPVVTVVQAGSKVEFPNSDNIRHSVYSFSPARTFVLKLYSGKPAAPVEFDKPGVVALGCNIHDRMIAWIAVVDSAWFAQSDATGRLDIRAVPEGDYRLAIWHPGIRSEAPARTLTIRAANDAQRLQIDTATIESLQPDTEGHRPADHG